MKVKYRSWFIKMRIQTLNSTFLTLYMHTDKNIKHLVVFRLWVRIFLSSLFLNKNQSSLLNFNFYRLAIALENLNLAHVIDLSYMGHFIGMELNWNISAGEYFLPCVSRSPIQKLFSSTYSLQQSNKAFHFLRTYFLTSKTLKIKLCIFTIIHF
jgi:hypothetical protein